MATAANDLDATTDWDTDLFAAWVADKVIKSTSLSSMQQLLHELEQDQGITVVEEKRDEVWERIQKHKRDHAKALEQLELHKYSVIQNSEAVFETDRVTALQKDYQKQHETFFDYWHSKFEKEVSKAIVDALLDVHEDYHSTDDEDEGEEELDDCDDEDDEDDEEEHSESGESESGSEDEQQGVNENDDPDMQESEMKALQADAEKIIAAAGASKRMRVV